MSNLYWLSEDQMGRLRPYFPMSRGRARVDDRRVLSGISSLIAMGCAGVTLPNNTVRTRLYTTAGNDGVIWGYLRGSWRGSLPKPRITRRSQSTQLTSRHTARPPAWG